MRLLKDAYGEVYSSNQNDSINDLEIIREEVLNLYNAFNSDALDKTENENPEIPEDRVVEILIGTNHFSTIESLVKIKALSEKYHNLIKGSVKTR